MGHTKLTKKESYLFQTLNAILLAGIIILFIGVYYCVIKAGIPYQDPPYRWAEDLLPPELHHFPAGRGFVPPFPDRCAEFFALHPAGLPPGQRLKDRLPGSIFRQRR